MQTILVKPKEANEAEPNVQQLYKAIEAKMHILPNIFKNMGNSADVLKGFLDLSEAANNTSLSPQLREKIALVVGEANKCQYCLSAHSLLGKLSGLKDSDMMQARKGSSNIPKEQAILLFIKKVVETKAHLADNDLADLKAAGVDDKEIVEIVLVTMVNMFTNYFNLITGTKIDFPLAPKMS